MIDKIILTRDEICDLISSVLQYNKKQATEFRFVLSDDTTLMTDFTCEIMCEAEPIKVRIVPEDDVGLGPAMDTAARMIDQWRRQRQSNPKNSMSPV